MMQAFLCALRSYGCKQSSKIKLGNQFIHAPSNDVSPYSKVMVHVLITQVELKCTTRSNAFKTAGSQ